MQSEYKEKQEDAKREIQSDIQCTFANLVSKRIFFHRTSCNLLAV